MFTYMKELNINFMAAGLPALSSIFSSIYPDFLFTLYAITQILIRLFVYFVYNFIRRLEDNRNPDSKWSKPSH